MLLQLGTMDIMHASEHLHAMGSLKINLKVTIQELRAIKWEKANLYIK